MKKALVGLVALLALSEPADALPVPVAIATGPYIAEGVAASAEGRPLVSGVLARTVRLIARQGPLDWLRPGRFAPLGDLFGMAADRKRDRLWIAETFGAGLPGQSGPDRTGLLEVELGSGRVLGRHTAPPEAARRTIGDVTLAADGSVYASDSTGGALYRLRPGHRDLELFAATGLKSPQGMVVSGRGAALIVADYASGLHWVDLTTGAHTPLDGEGARLRGIDGLVRDGSSLIATQNGGTPNRILRLHLSADERTVESVEMLVQGPEGLDDLSLGAVIGRRFVFVAHSQWGAVGAGGALSPNPGTALLSSVDLGPPGQQAAPRNGRKP